MYICREIKGKKKEKKSKLKLGGERRPESRNSFGLMAVNNLN
jgi:hypothetical protein